MKKYYDYFKHVKLKVTGKWIHSVVKGTPQKLTDFILYVHEVFDCRLPNDWIYEMVADAFRDFQIGELSLADFISQEQVDSYERDLIKRLKKGYTAEYCNEVVRKWKAKTDIYRLVALFLSDEE